MALRRQLKNVVRNYTEAQIKVREATSNDPWGPSSSLMSEIADLTYNVVAFSEIMQMVWKRLNDHGKNWRHVYKSLVLLDYLVKTGSERVTQQCRENIFAIQTLKDFQYVEDGKDQGVNVRERAKGLVALLKDDERLKTERAKALKAKERFAQNAMGFGSGGGPTNGSVMRGAHAGSSNRTGGNYADPYGGAGGSSTDIDRNLNPDLEAARPSTVGEEELQLQLALAMSKEEHDQEVQRKKHDDYKLELAMKESQKDPVQRQQQFPSTNAYTKSRLKHADDPVEPELLDIADVFTNKSKPSSYGAQADPWSTGASSKPPAAGFVAFDGAGDPWATSSGKSQSPSDPWNSNSSPAPATRADPWGDTRVESPPKGFDPFGATQSSNNSKPNNLDDFDLLSSSRQMTTSSSMSAMATNSSHSPWDLSGVGAAMPAASGQPADNGKKTPDAFLDPHFTSLVNLDQLVGPGQNKNPFGISASNPFHQNQPRIPLNQMMQPRTTSFTPPAQTGGLPAPLIPGPSGNPGNAYPAANPTNPFLMM